jgi:hypothetical protein
MKTLAFLCALSLLPASVLAQGKKPSAAETKNYNSALEEGRKLHVEKDYQGAIKAFEKALAAKPNDPQALSELGYAAYFDKNYSYALECTQKAIDNSTDKELRGAAYYNLALILEETGKKSKAIDALVTSYTERPNRVVREKLAKLDAAKAAQLDPAAPKQMQGYYDDIDAWCLVTRPITDINEEEPPYNCRADEELTQGVLNIKPGTAYKNIRFVYKSTSEMEDAEKDYYIAIQTKKGWYVSKPLEYIYNPGAMGISNEITIDKIEIKELVGGGEPEIRIDYTVVRADSDMAGAIINTNTNKSTVFCGLTSYGTPSCTDPIQTANSTETDTEFWDEEELGPKPKTEPPTSWNLNISLSDGQLEIKQGTLKGIKSLPASAKAILGKRAFSF